MTTFLRQERCLEFDISKDPVRPELDMEFRTMGSREVYSLVYKDEVVAVICIAYCVEPPTTVQELDDWGVNAPEYIAVPYTVWSLKHGFGRSIIMETIKHIKATKPDVTRVVTLSPKTEMARRFHMANGAKHIASNAKSNNFEYSLEGI